MKDKFRSALWLIKSVEQRQKTIHKVATSIINFQKEFLDHGIEYLRPLVLRDVANDIGMHESTVSRVVTNKYMHTPQGVFEMKYFFHSGIASSYGEAVSSVTIKQRIRKIIEQEDPRKPLSDSKIVSILQREGLELARRTIAKYREELKIPTSNQRKVLIGALLSVRPARAVRRRSHAPRTDRPSHHDHAQSIRRLIEQRLAPMLRLLNDSAVSAQVVLTKLKTRVQAEVTLHARGEHFLHGAGDRPRRRRGAERRCRQGRSPGAQPEEPLEQGQAPGCLGGEGRLGRDPARPRRVEASAAAKARAACRRARPLRIVRARRYEVKPMSVDEAALEVVDADDAFLVFRNAATDTINVLFRRPNQASFVKFTNTCAPCWTA